MKTSLLQNVEHVIYGKLDNGTPFTIRTTDIAGFLMNKPDDHVTVSYSSPRGEEGQTQVRMGVLNVIAIVAQGRHGELSFDEAMDLLK